MSDLRDFLLARIAEDEGVACAAQDPDVGWGGVDFNSATAAAHGYRHHPARVLAEVEAKRRIVDEHQHRQHGLDGRGGEDEWECVTCSRGTSGWWCATLRLLALPYADHPDYDEGWRP